MSTTLSPRQFVWSVAAFAAAALPATLWLPAGHSALLGLVVGIRLATARRRPQPWPGWLRVVLVAAFLFVVINQFGNILGRAPGGALLLSMLALKTTESATRRDARLLVTVSLFLIIAGFLMNQSISALLLGVGGAAVCFAALEMLSRPSVGGPDRSPFGRLAFGEVGLLLALAVPLTVALWLLFPRFSTPLWGTLDGNNGRSGLSNEMKPGDVRELMLDDSPAFRVTFDNGAKPDPNALYFRGPVLWEFDGETWRGAPFLAANQEPLPAPSAQDLSYEVIMEPSDQRLLFAADQAVEVSERANFSTEQRFIRFRQISELLSYRARSRLSTSVPVGRLPGQTRKFALRLPTGFDPKTVELALTWAAESGGDQRAIVRRAMQHFAEQEFRYTLAPPEILGSNRNDEFLFESRSGYCEHYAGAFAVLMRAAGVPTRVVTGFYGGKYNASGGYLLVANSRAHAWNEVLIGDAWERVDPTSAIPRERIDESANDALGNNRPAWLQGIYDQVDFASDWWNRAVLGFNAARQAQLLKPFGIDNADWQDLVGVLALVVAVLSLTWAGLVWWRSPKAKADPLAASYQRFCAKLAKAAVLRAVDEAPRDFAQRSAQALPAQASTILEITAEFEKLRYAVEPQSAQIQQFAERVKAFQVP